MNKITDTAGSSPLSRGILNWWQQNGYGGGIIPALAGNTTGWGEVNYVLPDHPRSRGEYGPEEAVPVLTRGSSPLSRGIPSRRSRSARAHGIIPALAGNTGSASRCRPCPTDHPRSRGEYYGGVRSAVYEAGSSPLSRGIPAAADHRPDP